MNPQATKAPPLRPGPRDETSTRLHGGWLVVARLTVAVLIGIILVITAAFIPVRLDQSLAVCSQDAPALAQLGLSVRLCAAYHLALSLVTVVGFVLLAALIFWRRSDDWMALFTALMLVGYGITRAYLGEPVPIPPAWQLPVNFVRAVGLSLAFMFGYIFPDGRFVPRWTGAIAVLTTAYTLSWTLFPVLPLNPLDFNTWPLGILLLLLVIAGELLAQVYRYRRVSNPMQRQQTKWIVAGIAAIFLSTVLGSLPYVMLPAVREPGLPRLLYTLSRRPLYELVLLFAAAGMGISILRYRLWDIDILVNRALVYTILTAMLALVYFGSVVLLEHILGGFTGDGTHPLVVVACTLAIAALFQPLRRRIQTFIDRRFYRRKYDLAGTLQAFRSRLRHEVDLDTLTDDLLSVVRRPCSPPTSRSGCATRREDSSPKPESAVCSKPRVR